MSVARLRGWVVVGAAVALAGCGAAEPRPNLVLITLESLRTDHVGAYGGHSRGRPELPITPNLDAFAREAVRFDDAHAVSSWTLTSHASLFTGLYPSAHRAVRPLDRLSDGYPTLAETLAAAGYQTVGVISGPYLRRAHNLAQGFEVWDDGIASLTSRLAHDDVTNPRMDEALDRFVASQRDPARPFFLFAYFWDPHYDYLPPPPHGSQFVGPDAQAIDLSHFESNPAIRSDMPPGQLAYVLSQYAGEVHWTDASLGRFFASLKRNGSWENTAILITADHGEEFFEHGEKGHKNNLYAESIHVPLLLKLPGAAGGRVDGRLASHVDVLPTLLELAGATAAFPHQGRSLLDPNPAPSRAIFFDLLSTWYYRRPDGTAFDATQRWHGVREGGEKLVWREGEAGAPLRALFDVSGDPGERVDLASTREARARDLEKLYAAQLRESEAIAQQHPPGGTAELSARELESLRALGYVGP